MASMRGAGMSSGSVISEVLRRGPASSSSYAAAAEGEGRRLGPLGHFTGGIPRAGGSFQQVCVPGYRGHIAGKVAENVHGQTFGAENERASQLLPSRETRRTASAPELLLATASRGAEGPRGLLVAPRVPGYAGTIPGKLSETVHGLRFAEANEVAQGLRESNPLVTCDGWLRRGQWPADRLATYKWNNRFSRTDTQDLFTPEQEQAACEANRRLGATFGLNPPRPNPHKPGDRYMHSLRKRTDKDKKRLDPTKIQAAGQPSVSAYLDQQRWLMHNAITLGNGNQRTAY